MEKETPAAEAIKHLARGRLIMNLLKRQVDDGGNGDMRAIVIERGGNGDMRSSSNSKSMSELVATAIIIVILLLLLRTIITFIISNNEGRNPEAQTRL